MPDDFRVGSIRIHPDSEAANIGVAIIAAGFYFQSWWGAIGIVPLMTGTLRWCPPYQLLGISTDKK